MYPFIHMGCFDKEYIQVTPYYSFLLPLPHNHAFFFLSVPKVSCIFLSIGNGFRESNIHERMPEESEALSVHLSQPYI